MTDPPPSTMAPPMAADLSRADQTVQTAPTDPKDPPTTKNAVMREFDLALCAFFPTPTAPAKFHPITAMQQLFRIMIKDESSLVLITANNDKQIILASESLPTSKSEFKKFFKVTTIRNEKQGKSHVCVGCYVLSNRTLGNIKFHSTNNNLLAWLKKERVFIELDSLGIDQPVMIGHFIKISPDIMHLPHFRDHLANQLMLIDINVDTAISLALHLKEAQLEAMTNGDKYITILPNF